MVLHRIPYDSTFLFQKFEVLSEHMDLWLLAWDRKRNLTRLPDTSRGLKNRVVLGPVGVNVPQIVRGVLIALGRFFRTPNRTIRFYRFLLNRHGFAKGSLRFLKYVSFLRLNPDLVHFEFGTLAREMIELKSFFGFKTIASFRGYDLNYVGLEYPDYYKEVWRDVDGLHFLGNDLRIRAGKRGYEGGKLETLISPAIDLEFFKRTTHFPSEQRPFRIVSVGRLVWKKGYEYGIQAVKRLVQLGYPLKYIIIGAGDFEQALRYYITELGMEGVVELVGNKSQHEIKMELERAYLFLHPAISEGFCNAVIEAQSMEVPVVCTDADGLSENVAHNETGFVVPKWQVTALVEAMRTMFENPTLAKEMSRNGRARAVELYSIGQQALKFVKFYDRVLKSH